MQNKCRIKQYEQYPVQAEAAIDRNFEIFLPKFLKNTCERAQKL